MSNVERVKNNNESPPASPKTSLEEKVKEFDEDLQKVSLRGHKGSVLCLASNNNSDNTIISGEKMNLLLSGSEDGTARIWDLRTHKTCMCILSPQRRVVTNVAFSFSSLLQNNDNNAYQVYLSTEFDDEDSDGVKYTPVYSYDVRNVSQTNMIIQEYSTDFTNVLQSTDDINQLSFNCNSKRNNRRNEPLYLAAPDDSGMIHITNIHNKTARPNTIQHSDNALVTSALFQPVNIFQQKQRQHRSNRSNKNKNQILLASGGTDCMIHLWDLNVPYKPIFSHHAKTYEDSTGSSTQSQLYNPPMVYSLDFSYSGKLLACGLGDGTCQILSLYNNNNNNNKQNNMSTRSKKNKKSKKKKGSNKANQQKTTPTKPTPSISNEKLTFDSVLRLNGIHHAAIACVHFPHNITHYIDSNTKESQAPKEEEEEEEENEENSENSHHLDDTHQNHHVTNRDRLLITAGNDEKIVFWDLGKQCAGDYAVSPRKNRLLSGRRKNKNKNNDDGDDYNTVSEENEGEKQNNNDHVLFYINHNHKPNWITSCANTNCSDDGVSSSFFPSSLFVADTTSDITAYMMR